MTCTSCRVTCAENDEDAPCEGPQGACPYTPSPGVEGHLAPQNVFVMWAYDHIQTLGETARMLIQWPEDPLERELTLEKLTFIARTDARLQAELAQRRPARGGPRHV